MIEVIRRGNPIPPQVWEECVEILTDFREAGNEWVMAGKPQAGPVAQEIRKHEGIYGQMADAIWFANWTPEQRKEWERIYDKTELDEKLLLIAQGETPVVSDEWLDSVTLPRSVVTIVNPNRVGILDKYVAGLVTNPVIHAARVSAGIASGEIDVVQCFELARNGQLPKGFDRWDMRDEHGNTVAHKAAMHGMLPPDFDQWELVDNEGWTVAHEAACQTPIHGGVTQWTLADPSDFTVAHAAAEYGHLPDDFTDWSMADKNGCTVAHIAALYGHLPVGFTQWDLADSTGWSVAHSAVRGGFLPGDFSQFDIADNAGWTVAHEIVTSEPSLLPEHFSQWEMADHGGLTVRQAAAAAGTVDKQAHSLKNGGAMTPKL